jgi:D-3-phosphoglycerate dehydrogenase
MPDEALQVLKQSDVVIEHHPHPTAEAVVVALAHADALILRSGICLTPDMVDSAPNLRAVIRAGSGTDNIPMRYLAQKGVRFSNIPAENAVSVAEFAIAVTISVMRNVFKAHEQMSGGIWEKNSNIGEELCNKTVGLVGLGNVGMALANRLLPFGVRLLGVRRSSVSPCKKIRLASLDTICGEANVIMLQVPLCDETRHLIGDRQFKLMKKQPYLVNLARQEIVDEDAMFSALKGGLLRAAIVDPTERNSPAPSRFAGLPVYLFPHIAGSTREAQVRVAHRIRALLSHWSILTI